MCAFRVAHAPVLLMSRKVHATGDEVCLSPHMLTHTRAWWHAVTNNRATSLPHCHGIGGDVSANEHVQDFPYTCEAGIEHHNIWCTAPLTMNEIELVIQAKRPREAGYDTMYFINPTELQSIPTVRAIRLADIGSLCNIAWCVCHTCLQVAWCPGQQQSVCTYICNLRTQH